MKSAAAHKALPECVGCLGKDGQLPAAFYAAGSRASALNQCTSTPQDEAELVPPKQNTAGGMASAPSAEPQHSTKALNQCTSTPQDEAELVTPHVLSEKSQFFMRGR